MSSLQIAGLGDHTYQPMSERFERPIHPGALTNLYGFSRGEQYVLDPYVSPVEHEEDQYRLTIEVDPVLRCRLEDTFWEARANLPSGRSVSERTQNWHSQEGRSDHEITLRSILAPKVSGGLNYDKSELNLEWRLPEHLFCVAGARLEILQYENPEDGSVKEVETILLCHSVDVYLEYEDATGQSELWKEGATVGSGLVVDF